MTDEASAADAPKEAEADEDGLDVSELVSTDGGTFRGLLFDNPAIGVAPQLTWTFAFEFEEVDRDYGSSPVCLDIDWVPLALPSWRDMAGQAVEFDGFAKPAESSVYFFAHHRYDAIALRVVEQRQQRIHVLAEVSGDLDRLGIPSMAVDAWLGFAGITVSLRDVSSEADALARLQDFTDPSGLFCSGGIPGTSYFFSANK
jgi:hypothetical protein